MAESQITGLLKRFRFQNGKGGWAVATFEVNQEEVTVVGPLPGLHQGDRCELFGEFVKDARWGDQFKCTKAIPTTTSGIEEFLNLLSDIGPKRAALIKEQFGDDIWKVIENAPERLREISGLTDERITRIREEYLERKEDKEVLVWCLDKGVTPYQVGLIQAHFERRTLSVLKKTPYKIVEAKGIGFLTADAIARKLGVKADSKERCRAAIAFVLKEIEESEGSTLVHGGIVMACLKGLERGPGGVEPPVRLQPVVPQPVIYEVLREMIKEGEVHLVGELVQSAESLQCEVRVAAGVVRFLGPVVVGADGAAGVTQEVDPPAALQADRGTRGEADPPGPETSVGPSLLSTPTTNVLNSESPTANMYGCEPCPKCGSNKRWPATKDEFKAPHEVSIECGECRFVETGEWTESGDQVPF